MLFIMGIMCSIFLPGCGSNNSSGNGVNDDDTSQADDDTSSTDDDSSAGDDDDTSPQQVVPTTLDLTLIPKENPTGSGNWSLEEGPGEPHQERNDLHVTASRNPGDAKPLSMTYFATFADFHISDEESPARLTFFDSNFIFGGMFEAAYRPQEDLSGQLANAIVRTADRIESDYGRDFDFALVLGDATDNSQSNEMKTLIDIFDAKGLLTGDPGWVRVDSGDLDIDPKTGRDQGERNFGIQETNQQGDTIDPFNRPGQPNSNADFSAPGLVRASGQQVPWFYTIGNHDVENMGVFDVDSLLTFYKREDYLSNRSPYGFLPGLANLVQYWKENPDQALHVGYGMIRMDLDWRLVFEAAQALGMIPPEYTKDLYPQLELMRLLNDTPAVSSDDGVDVVPDPEREFLGRDGSVKLCFNNVHGFADRPSNAVAYYRLDWEDIAPSSDLPLRVLSLDSTEKESFSTGGVSDDQLNWLQGELDQAISDEKLVIVTSHYTVGKIKNGGDALDKMLEANPNVILFLEGHGHDNLVVPHPGTGGGYPHGYWEVETPSNINFPQQARIFEIVDNRDGTGTIYVTLFDHWAIQGDDADKLSDLGRQLAFEDALAKDWDGKTPLGGMGQVSDRNVALLFAIPDEIADKLAEIPSTGEITSVDSLGKLYQP